MNRTRHATRDSAIILASTAITFLALDELRRTLRRTPRPAPPLLPPSPHGDLFVLTATYDGAPAPRWVRPASEAEHALSHRAADPDHGTPGVFAVTAEETFITPENPRWNAGLGDFTQRLTYYYVVCPAGRACPIAEDLPDSRPAS